MKVKILSPAELQLKDAYEFYELQLEGLGSKFLESFLQTVNLIKKIPQGWRKVSKNTRRINVNNFPYLILYVLDNNTILITFVCHSHRAPSYYTKHYR